MEVFFDNLFKFMGNYLIIVAWIIMWVTVAWCFMNDVKSAWLRLLIALATLFICPIVFPIVIGEKLAEWVLGRKIGYEHNENEDDSGLKL